MPDQQPISINERQDDWEGLQRTLNYMFKDIYSLLDEIQGRAGKTFEPESIILPDPPAITYSVHNHESDAQGGKIDHGSALDGLNDIADHPGYVALNGTRAMTADWNIGSNDLGIGVAPSYHIHSVKTDASVATAYSFYTDHEFTGNHPGGGNITQYGQYFNATSKVVGTQVAGNRASLYGLGVISDIDSPGQVYENTAIYGLAQHNHTTALTYQYGGQFVVKNNAAATISNAVGIKSRIQRVAGTITSGILYFGEYSGTVGTKWGLYIGGETKNYLSGSLGLGTGLPAGIFHTYENNALVNNTVGATIEQDGTGDADLHFILTGTKTWTMGIDNSSSDKFVIAENDNIAANARFVIHTGGNVGIKAPTSSTAVLAVGYDGANHFRYYGNNGFGPGVLDLESSSNADPILHIKGTGTADLVNLYDDGTKVISIAADGEITLYSTARVTVDDYLDADGIKAPGSKPATYVSHGLGGVWQFSDEAVAGNQQTVSGRFKLPSAMDKTVVPIFKIGWSADGANPGDCEWQLEYLYLSPGEATDGAAQETLTATGTASATANGAVITSFSGVDLPSATDQAMIFRIKRLSAGGNDTIADTVELMGVFYTNTRNKLGTAT